MQLSTQIPHASGAVATNECKISISVSTVKGLKVQFVIYSQNFSLKHFFLKQWC